MSTKTIFLLQCADTLWLFHTKRGKVILRVFINYIFFGKNKITYLFFSFKVQTAFIEEIEVVVKEFVASKHEQGNCLKVHCSTDCNNEFMETTLLSLNTEIYKILSRT